MKKQKKNMQNGITLIALVITIIVLLILAGVSINAIVGENGVLSKAQLAKTKTEKSAEEEAIQLALVTGIIDNKIGSEDSSDKLGVPLYDKKVENGSKWNIIVMNDGSRKEPYGTGYTYLEKGTNVEGFGQLQKAWIINDATSEIIELEDGTYTNLSFGDALGVSEGLIFSLDPAIIDSGLDALNYKSKLGDRVTLYNCDWNENSGFNLANKSFKLDGIDDYITIDFDSEHYAQERLGLEKNGFTFEFFGNLKNATTRGDFKWEE